MWSLAIWDHRRRSLFLARDRFGVKPLYVTIDSRRLAFASELKAFLYLDGFAAEANAEVVQARLAGNFSNGVLLSHVESLPAGCWMEVTIERTQRQRWWNTLDHLVSAPSDGAAQAEEFRTLLFDACQLRLRSDVPLATSLSGGLDSSSVLCSLAAVQERGRAPRQPADWRRAFIASFPGTIQDEADYAILAAERADAIPVIRRFTGDDFRGNLDSYLYHFEEIGGLAGCASWALYREMRRQGVIVSLDGHGGDELLGGYSLHVLLALIRSGGVFAAPRRTFDLIDTLQRMHRAEQPGAPRNKALLAALTIPAVRAVARRFPLLGRSQRSLEEVLRRH
jgi:asparagine synthase (glutamine-hydrolysing)